MRTLAMDTPGYDRASHSRGRLTGPRGVLLADPRHSMVLPHLVAVVEEFSRTQLIEQSLLEIDVTKALQRSLWATGESRAEGTWDGQVGAWREWHGLDLEHGAGYRELRAFVEARNAIMHGLGRLTRKQLRKHGGREVIASLNQVGIGVSGGALSFPFSVLPHCAAVGRSFIEWMDTEIQTL
jgi:hypothetical protein